MREKTETYIYPFSKEEEDYIKQITSSKQVDKLVYEMAKKWGNVNIVTNEWLEPGIAYEPEKSEESLPISRMDFSIVTSEGLIYNSINFTINEIKFDSLVENAIDNALAEHNLNRKYRVYFRFYDSANIFQFRISIESEKPRMISLKTQDHSVEHPKFIKWWDRALDLIPIGANIEISFDGGKKTIVIEKR